MMYKYFKLYIYIYIYIHTYIYMLDVGSVCTGIYTNKTYGHVLQEAPKQLGVQNIPENWLSLLVLVHVRGKHCRKALERSRGLG